MVNTNDSAKITDLADSQAKDGLLVKEAQGEIDELTGQASVQISRCRCMHAGPDPKTATCSESEKPVQRTDSSPCRFHVPLVSLPKLTSGEEDRF